MLVTQAGFARRLQVSKATVARAVKKGRIPLTPEGKIDLEPALKLWEETKDYSQDRGRGNQENQEGATVDGETYHGWNTRKVKAQALRLEIENEKEKGTLLSVDRVKFLWADAVLRMCSKLDAIPQKAAALCAHKSAKEIREIMVRLVRECREELANLSGEYHTEG